MHRPRLVQSAPLLCVILLLANGCSRQSNDSRPSTGKISPSSTVAAPPEAQGAPPDARKPELVVQAGHASPVNVVSFSPDCKLLASGSGQAWSFVEVNVVKLWDVASGTELRTFKHDSPVAWIGFSADGRRMAARGESIGPGKPTVWDVASGAKLADKDEQFISSATSSDGKLAAAVAGKKIHIRDVATGQPLRTLDSRTSDFQKAMFSPDSSVLACGGSRYSIRLWDLRGGVLRTLEGHKHFPVVADFSPDSRLLASGGHDLAVHLWDVASGREINTLVGHTKAPVRGMHFSPNGKTLLSFDKAGFKLWDVASGRQLASGSGDHDDAYQKVLFSPDGKLLAATTDGAVILYETETGDEVHVLPGNGGRLDFSPDGKFLCNEDSLIAELWEVASGERLAAIEPAEKSENFLEVRVARTVFSPDGRVLAVSEYDSRGDGRKWQLHLHDVPTGKRLRTIEGDAGHLDPDGSLVFSADSRQIMNDGSGDDVTWEVASGERVENFKRPPTYSDSPDGRFRYAFGNNGEIELLDPKTSRPIASLIGIDERDWLVATPEGFFDGSPEAWKRIIWRFDNDTFNHAPLEAFFNEFYHPGLLSDVIAGHAPAVPAGKDLAKIDRRGPTVTISQIDAATTGDEDIAHAARLVTLAVDVAENASTPAQAGHPPSSGARDVRLFRNGSLVKAWRGDAFAFGASEGCKPSSTTAPKHVRCEVQVPIVAGANEFAAYAFNHANVKSGDAMLSIAGAESLRRGATLHILAVGVNEYEDARLKLRYAVADAQGFAAEVERQQAALQAFERIDTTLLLDARATRRNFVAALDELSLGVQPEDTVIIYFAGHGMASRNQFYLIPHDAGSSKQRSAANDDVAACLVQNGISDRELERSFERIDAAGFLFVVDACQSGQALEAEEKRRGPMNSKGLAQLAYEKGIFVLTAAQSFQAAQEVSKLRHGLLTYVLVEEGLKRSAADAEPRDNRILLREWLDYAARRVPQARDMQHAIARGGDGVNIDESKSNAVTEHREQRPRVFYRRETERNPLVVADPRLNDSVPDELQSENDPTITADADGERSVLGIFRKGPAEDLRAEIVEEQNGVYHTQNRTQAVLGTYGKLVAGKRLVGRLPKFEHRGLVQQLERVRRFVTVQRQGRRGGKDFLSFVGNHQAYQVVDLAVQASGGRQNEVTFEMVGLRLDQNDVIKALNSDGDALTYFEYLRTNKEAPCLVLENVVFTSCSVAESTTLALGGSAKTALTTDGGAARVQNQRSSSTQFTSPVVRCYQMYEVKLHQNRVVELVSLAP